MRVDGRHAATVSAPRRATLSRIARPPGILTAPMPKKSRIPGRDPGLGPGRPHRGPLRLARQPRAAGGGGRRRRRPHRLPGGQLMLTTDVDNYPGLPGGHPGPRADGALPQAGRALRHRVRRAAPARRSTSRGAPSRSRWTRATVAGGDADRRHRRARALAGPARGAGVPHAGSAASPPARPATASSTRARRCWWWAAATPRWRRRPSSPSSRRKVTVVHRRDTLRASKIMQERALKNPKIALALGQRGREDPGRRRDQGVTGARVRNLKTGEVTRGAGGRHLHGHRPRAEHRAFRGQLEMDASGYLRHARPAPPPPACPACSPPATCRTPRYRQAVTAAGTGCMAAIDAERFLGEHVTEAGASRRRTAARGSVPPARRRAERALRILFLAPQPFFEVRGTPLAVLAMVRALAGARPPGRPAHLPAGRGRRRRRRAPPAQPAPARGTRAARARRWPSSLLDVPFMAEACVADGHRPLRRRARGRGGRAPGRARGAPAAAAAGGGRGLLDPRPAPRVGLRARAGRCCGRRERARAATRCATPPR